MQDRGDRPDGQRLGKNTMAKDETIVGMLDLLGMTSFPQRLVQNQELVGKT